MSGSRFDYTGTERTDNETTVIDSDDDDDDLNNSVEAAVSAPTASLRVNVSLTGWFYSCQPS